MADFMAGFFYDPLDTVSNLFYDPKIFWGVPLMFALLREGLRRLKERPPGRSR